VTRVDVSTIGITSNDSTAQPAQASIRWRIRSPLVRPINVSLLRMMATWA
jgi:hypothetical protein